VSAPERVPTAELIERAREEADPLLGVSSLGDLLTALADRLEAQHEALDTIRRWFLNPGDPGYDEAKRPPLIPRPGRIAADAVEGW
jgi:hypothetical protein